jgi:CRISPR-associated protein Cas2
VDRIDILVAYDVETSLDGPRRLARVAKICKNFGQRVQLSVFECRLTKAQLIDLEAKLTNVMLPERDSLRIYLLVGDRKTYLRTFGRDRYEDFDDPLIL